MQEMKKRLARLAISIYARRCDQSPSTPHVDRTAWRLIESKLRLLSIAHQRGWTAASRKLTNDLCSQALNAEASLANLRTVLSPPPTKVRFAASEVYEALLAIETEFEGLEYSRREKWIAATTESIELDGVQLGRFQIKASWMYDEAEFDVVALDPNPASGNENVTHPHVDTEKLCVGEASLAIRAAWKQQRFDDFFLIVRSVLRTYNVDSPYIPLSDWDGVGCSECGDTVAREESSGCVNCSANMCCDCDTLCHGCEASLCSNCIKDCAGCDRGHCAECLDACVDCSEPCCRGCLDDDDRCEVCRAELETQSDSKEVTDEPFPANSSIQSDRVGEVALPS